MRQSSPDIKILYHARHGEWQDITEYLASFQCQSSLSQSFTSFTIVLKNNRTSLFGDLKQMDMVRVWLGNGSVSKPVLMPGFVSNIKDDYNLAKGAISDNATITGMDIGKLMVKRDIIYMPAIGFPGLLVMKGNPHNGTSEDIIKKLIKYLLFDQKIQLADGKDIKAWLDIEKHIEEVSKDKGYDWKIFEAENFYFNHGDLWKIVKQYSNQTMNEVFTQPGEDKTYLVLRKRPFQSSDWPNAWKDLNSKWFGRYETDFSDGPVIKRSLGISDDDTYNFWAVSNQIGGLSNEDMIAFLRGQESAGTVNGKNIPMPIYDAESINRYGLRSYMATTPFLPVKNQENQEFCFQGMRLATLRIFEWYCINEEFENGSITIYGGAPDLYIGMPVVNTSTGLEYYCEGVSHSWSPGNLTTTANLTRGIRPQDLVDLKTLKMSKLGVL